MSRSVGLRIGIVLRTFDSESIQLAVEADRLGADSVWVPEIWMYDALTPLAFLAAKTERIRLGTGTVQLGSRSPALLAMSALAMQKLSGGRFVLGLGTSGPQVIEGWHGVPFDRPVTRTRETIDIVRKAMAGERLTYEGEVYTLPRPGGEGKALRSPVGGVTVPIYVGSIGPANLRMTGAMADGWIGTSFIPESAAAFMEPLAEGAAQSGRTLADLDLTVATGLEFTRSGGPSAEAIARGHADGYAFTMGAMGSATTNFYNRAFTRQGYGETVEEVERLWRGGDREAAAAAVPIELGYRTNLIGDDAAVTERLRAYRDCGVTLLRISPSRERPELRVDDLARLLDLVERVNNE